jgi:hypothetical protein
MPTESWQVLKERLHRNVVWHARRKASMPPRYRRACAILRIAADEKLVLQRFFLDELGGCCVATRSLACVGYAIVEQVRRETFQKKIVSSVSRKIDTRKLP